MDIFLESGVGEAIENGATHFVGPHVSDLDHLSEVISGNINEANKNVEHVAGVEVLQELEDQKMSISVSRPESRLQWGIKVPED